MNAEQADRARREFLYTDAQAIERRVRVFAEILVNDFDPLRHVVQQKQVTWLEHRNRGYSNPVGGTLEFPPLRTLTLCIPGGDFAAQLVVEQQIRDQLAPKVGEAAGTQQARPVGAKRP
jgi:hypothetical protein